MSLQSDNSKRNSILEKGQELFWKYGIKRVTVEEICKEASVSKMTFYKNFSNKTELAKYILTTLIKQAFASFEEMLNGDLSYKEKIEFIMQTKLSSADNMSNEFFKEAWADKSSTLYDIIEKNKEKSNQLFIDFLKQGQKDGNIRKDLNVNFAIHFTNNLTNLYEDEVFVNKFGSVKDLTKEIMNFLFYGISKR